MSEPKEKSLNKKENGTTPSQSSVDQQGRTVSVQTVVSVLLLVLVLIFALVNTQAVRINLLLLKVDLPLFLVIIGSFLAGGIVALLTSWNKRRKTKKQHK